MVVYGTEMVYLADTTKQECVELDATNDYIGTCGDWDSCVRLTTEDVLVVFPGEAHKLRGMCSLNC